MPGSEFVIKDSGERQQFDTGAQRDSQQGKPRYDLIPPRALRRVAMIYAGGAEKYNENNWMKGMPYSRTLSSAERHLKSFEAGEQDEDHLAQAVWNLLALLHYEEYPQWYAHLNNLVDYNAETLADALHLPKDEAAKSQPSVPDEGVSVSHHWPSD